ncbi:uncharacterized protein LOC113511228 isoform X2 [Galleria mellonella]|uniref:Uncharacterized protein LOC113511228 isoform X2 n=1 Tax=Galleria mellonella TaxID=7137 RepID=A0ABM3N6I7_GALME|nr:uncharacterized protein LOC113511228 isoform X2 [Galleria mellonella]
MKTVMALIEKVSQWSRIKKRMMNVGPEETGLEQSNNEIIVVVEPLGDDRFKKQELKVHIDPPEPYRIKPQDVKIQLIETPVSNGDQQNIEAPECSSINRSCNSANQQNEEVKKTAATVTTRSGGGWKNERKLSKWRKKKSWKKSKSRVGDLKKVKIEVSQPIGSRGDDQQNVETEVPRPIKSPEIEYVKIKTEVIEPASESPTCENEVLMTEAIEPAKSIYYEATTEDPLNCDRTSNSMAELEKFKRRLIRTVARLRQQKIPENELWGQLQKNTKCDCQWMWNRMRSLTIKRLKRLLLAVDRQENITAVARMKLTDWMMLDFILVHEKVDLTGANLNLKSEPLSLLELFSLVQRFGVEGRSGDELASAWTAATVYYNSQGRQCSPMLLQRRWYQMKEHTRNRFYNFWFTYRGNAKYLSEARAQHDPTKLQMAIAKRYPHIITMPFLPWEELIEKRLAILPEEFEEKMRTLHKASDLPKPCNENTPGFVIVEPEMEVIDLEVNSESETEYDEQDMVTEAQKMLSTTDIDGKSHNSNSTVAATEFNFAKTSTSQLTSVKLEVQEITTEEADDSNCEDLATTIIPIHDNAIGDISTCIEDPQGVHEIISEEQQTTVESCTDNYLTGDVKISNQLFSEKEQSTMKCFTNNCSVSDLERVSEIINKEKQVTAKYLTNPTGVNVLEIKSEPLSNEIRTNPLEPIIMPLITNVFGNVYVENEVLPKIADILLENCKDASVVTEDTVKVSDIKAIKEPTLIEVEKIVKNEIEEMDIEENIISNSDVEEILNTPIVKDRINIKKEVDNCEDTLINTKLKDNVAELADNGVPLFDDNENIDTHIIPLSLNNEEKETAKFDLKLLMKPVVYTTKLDDMHYFSYNEFVHVKYITNINDIIIKSKPISKRSIDNSLKQNPIDSKFDLEDEYMNDDLFDNNSLGNESSLSSESENNEVPEQIKVSMSSALLQKPRIRTYNFINLCKNPDFNTRLKRLTLGFLSSTRNRQLIKTCKPMTIDVNKDFESKLINNTLFLKSCSVPNNDKPVSDISMETSNLDEQTTTIVPSAMSVQSLINNTKINMQDLLPISHPNVNSGANKLHRQEICKNQQDLCKRKKIIKLSDIDTAIVTPIHIREDNEENEMVPIQIGSQSVQISSTESQRNHVPTITQSIIDGFNTAEDSDHRNSNIDAGTICIDFPPKERRPTNSNLIKENSSIKENTLNATKKGKPIEKPIWTPRFAASINWYKKQNTKQQESQTLLTVDTLNKMFNVICPDRDTTTKKYKKNSKKISKAFKNQQTELQQKLDEFEKISNSKRLNAINKDENNLSNAIKKDGTIDSHMSATKLPTFGIQLKPKQSLMVIDCNKNCCWARQKINEVHLKSIQKHNHPLNQCTCCCNKDLDDFLIKKRKSTTSESAVLYDDDDSSPKKISKSVAQKLTPDLCTSSSIEVKYKDSSKLLPVSDIIDVDNYNIESSVKHNSIQPLPNHVPLHVSKLPFTLIRRSKNKLVPGHECIFNKGPNKIPTLPLYNLKKQMVINGQGLQDPQFPSSVTFNNKVVFINSKHEKGKRKRKQRVVLTDSFDVSDKLPEQVDDSHYNSSDDEPLANKSKQVRREDTKNNSANVESEAFGIYNENRSINTTQTYNLVNELPNERIVNSLESESHPSISLISEVDTLHDDCILGV